LYFTQVIRKVSWCAFKLHGSLLWSLCFNSFREN
jgi:hypothetical protein